MSVTFVVEIQLSALDSSKGSIQFYKKLVCKGFMDIFSDRIEKVRRVLNVVENHFQLQAFSNLLFPFVILNVTK